MRKRMISTLLILRRYKGFEKHPKLSSLFYYYLCFFFLGGRRVGKKRKTNNFSYLSHGKNSSLVGINFTQF